MISEGNVITQKYEGRKVHIFCTKNVTDPVIVTEKSEIKGAAQIRKTSFLCTVKEGVAQERDRNKEEDEENERAF